MKPADTNVTTDTGDSPAAALALKTLHFTGNYGCTGPVQPGRQPEPEDMCMHFHFHMRKQRAPGSGEVGQ